MRDRVISHIRHQFEAHRTLAEWLPGEALSRRLSVPSNTVGAQLWCVVGARESYTRAIDTGVWEGFACSLSAAGAVDKAQVVAALTRAAEVFDRVAAGVDWTPARDHLLLDLLEHEAQHQGQLIRYVYALPYRFPPSWASRWSLGE